MQCPTSEAVDSSPSDTNGFIYLDDNVSSNMSDEEDDEYFIFAGRGIVDVIVASSFPRIGDPSQDKTYITSHISFIQVTMKIVMIK